MIKKEKSLFSSEQIATIFLSKNKSRTLKAESAYGNMLRESKKIRLFYGNISKKYLQKIFQKTFHFSCQDHFSLFTVLESRLDVVLYRSGFFETIAAAKQWISTGAIEINKKKVFSPSTQITPGDIVQILKRSKIKNEIFIESPLIGQKKHFFNKATILGGACQSKIDITYRYGPSENRADKDTSKPPTQVKFSKNSSNINSNAIHTFVKTIYSTTTFGNLMRTFLGSMEDNGYASIKQQTSNFFEDLNKTNNLGKINLEKKVTGWRFKASPFLLTLLNKSKTANSSNLQGVIDSETFYSTFAEKRNSYETSYEKRQKVTVIRKTFCEASLEKQKVASTHLQLSQSEHAQSPFSIVPKFCFSNSWFFSNYKLFLRRQLLTAVKKLFKPKSQKKVSISRPVGAGGYATKKDSSVSSAIKVRCFSKQKKKKILFFKEQLFFASKRNKPLHLEISYKSKQIIFLFPPQRISFPHFINASHIYK